MLSTEVVSNNLRGSSSSLPSEEASREIEENAEREKEKAKAEEFLRQTLAQRRDQLSEQDALRLQFLEQKKATREESKKLDEEWKAHQTELDQMRSKIEATKKEHAEAEEKRAQTSLEVAEAELRRADEERQRAAAAAATAAAVALREAEEKKLEAIRLQHAAREAEMKRLEEVRLKRAEEDAKAAPVAAESVSQLPENPVVKPEQSQERGATSLKAVTPASPVTSPHGPLASSHGQTGVHVALTEQINRDGACKLPMVSFEIAVLALAIFLTPQGINSTSDFLLLSGRFFGVFCFLICLVSLMTPGGELVMLCCTDYCK